MKCIVTIDLNVDYMLLEVTHETHYTYDKLVYLEPHALLLHPPTYAYQYIQKFRLVITPEPSVCTRANDIEGNSVYMLAFQDLTEHLVIQTTFQAETFRSNPFDYVLYPFETCTLPFQYPLHLHQLLKPYLQPLSRHRNIESFALQCANEAQHSTLRLLMHLTETINREFVYNHTPSLTTRLPEEILRVKRGSCHDLSLLMVDTCRMLGIAARFANGYYMGHPPLENPHLHTWVEVFLPGAGWRGYDPAMGIAVADRHITLASSAYPQLIEPIQGTYRGDAQSNLNTTIEIKPV